MNSNDVMVRYENNLFAKEYLTLKSERYFNAGVMLCNLKAWREHNLSKKLFEIAYKYKGKLKYKLFHKCCFPGCNRTFSSSGWLKAHLKEHLKQIENNWFNKAFKKYIYKGQISKKSNEQIDKDTIKGKSINGKKKNIFVVDK